MKKFFLKIIVLLLIIFSLSLLLNKDKIEKKELQKNKEIEQIKVKKQTEEKEEFKKEETKIILENPKRNEKKRKARITSYWVNDDCNSEDMTASGKNSKDFQLNEKGWYTWNGKLVIATASARLGKTNQKTYKLYEELTLIINGERYNAIVLDVCGACMRDNRIDLYVKDKAHMIDTMIEVIE